MNKRQQDIAYELAQKAHEGQSRRDGVTPYFNHVIDVARIAQMRGGNDLVIAAALLHDCLEQTNLTANQMLDAGIKNDVIIAVEALTLDKRFSYEANIQYLKENKIARQVKIADNLSNLGDDPTDKQILKYAKSLQILMS
jgi:(p)ppGpp synthase/HD superfamily hydrolase